MEPCCEKCGEDDYYLIRDCSPCGVAPMRLCFACRRDLDVLLVGNFYWQHVLKTNALLRAYTEQTPKNIDEEKIKKLWGERIVCEQELQKILRNWLEGTTIINIEGLDIKIKDK